MAVVAGRPPPARQCTLMTGKLLAPRAKHGTALHRSYSFQPTPSSESQPYYPLGMSGWVDTTRIACGLMIQCGTNYMKWGTPPPGFEFPILSMCIHTYVAAPEPCSLKTINDYPPSPTWSLTIHSDRPISRSDVNARGALARDKKEPLADKMVCKRSVGGMK